MPCIEVGLALPRGRDSTTCCPISRAPPAGRGVASPRPPNHNKGAAKPRPYLEMQLGQHAVLSLPNNATPQSDDTTPRQRVPMSPCPLAAFSRAHLSTFAQELRPICTFARLAQILSPRLFPDSPLDPFPDSSPTLPPTLPPTPPSTLNPRLFPDSALDSQPTTLPRPFLRLSPDSALDPSHDSSSTQRSIPDSSPTPPSTPPSTLPSTPPSTLSSTLSSTLPSTLPSIPRSTSLRARGSRQHSSTRRSVG
jgi:hypothetical protein